MNIRTKERRVIVAHNYNVEVVAYLTLLNNQKIKSAAGGIVKNRYFIFRLTQEKINFLSHNFQLFLNYL